MCVVIVEISNIFSGIHIIIQLPLDAWWCDGVCSEIIVSITFKNKQNENGSFALTLCWKINFFSDQSLMDQAPAQDGISLKIYFSRFFRVVWCMVCNDELWMIFFLLRTKINSHEQSQKRSLRDPPDTASLTCVCPDTVVKCDHCTNSPIVLHSIWFALIVAPVRPWICAMLDIFGFLLDRHKPQTTGKRFP